jgi:nicotinamide-nucleotide amidase
MTNLTSRDLHAGDTPAEVAVARLVNSIADQATELHIKIGAAESLTAGRLASALASGEGASLWFRGSIVAYHTIAKREILKVGAPAIITAECSAEMAAGARAALHADVVVSTTGVGGPGAEEGEAPGTVFICVASRAETVTNEFHFTGGPTEIVAKATTSALSELARTLEHVRSSGGFPHHDARGEVNPRGRRVRPSDWY